jgi:hypothetical protein
MLKLVKECAPWLNWTNAAVAALVVGAIVICTGLPSLGVLAGIAPVLLLVACLVPCLAPLVLLRRKNREWVAQAEPNMSSCGCGQDSCRTGDSSNACQSEAITTKATRS